MAWWDTLWPIIAALLPTAGLLFLFAVIMRRIVEADRRERAAEHQWRAERDTREIRSEDPPGTVS